MAVRPHENIGRKTVSALIACSLVTSLTPLAGGVAYAEETEVAESTDASIDLADDFSDITLPASEEDQNSVTSSAERLSASAKSRRASARVSSPLLT